MSEYNTPVTPVPQHSDNQGLDGQHPAPPRSSGKGPLLKLALALLVIAAILLLIGLIPRLALRPKIKEATQEQVDAVPTVNYVYVQTPPPTDLLTLPGNIEAIEQTAITAQASGYVKQWLVDIGDHVKAGQTLAIISTPDLDQEVIQAQAQVAASKAALSQAQANLITQRANFTQAQANLSRSQATLAQARTDLAHSQASLAQAQEATAQQEAQLTQAQANLNLAKITAQRYENLLAEGAIDAQTTDQAVASYQTNQANVQALTSAVGASKANAKAFADAVLSSRANVIAYLDGVASSRAQVTAAAANVRSFEANVGASSDNVQANSANLARLVAEQGFQRVTAPFSGIITARNIANGALISSGGGVSGAGSDSETLGSGSTGATTLGNAASGSASTNGSAPSGGGGSPTSLFSLAQTNALRIYVSVPQTYASMIHVGQPAAILVRDIPGKPFQGRVARTAGALDPTTRMLVTEIDLPNPRGLLQPGMFAEVSLRVHHPGNALLIPDSAFITDANNTQTIVIRRNNTLHYQSITVGRDFGRVIEVLSGLRKGQRVASTPNDTLLEGEKVHPVPALSAAQGGG